jgi:hypothetical protein
MHPADLLRAFRDECSKFFDMLYRLRAVLLLAPLLVLGFANDQVIDIAHEYLGSDRHFLDRFDFALITLLITAALPLLFIAFILDQRYSGESRYSLGRRLAIGAVLLLPILPALYFWSELDSGPTKLVSSQYTAWNTSITNILLLATTSSVLLALLPPIIIAPLAYAWRTLRLRWVYICLTVLVLVAYTSLCLLPLLVSNESLFPLVRGVANRLGVFPFIGLFLLAIFSIAALSSFAFDTWRIPVFSVLVLTAVVFSVTGLNSDFNARLLGTGETEMKPPPIATAFREWLTNRKDYAQYRGANPPRPYPVYLVAMAGGGAYAGFHSSYFLARLFESCPKFRHHTFAISAVSGGALGAALIATEAARKPGSTEPINVDAVLKCDADPGLADAGPDSAKIEKFFSLDHFSFLVWARLYPDMLRRLFWFRAHNMTSDALFEEWFNSNWTSIAADPKALGLSDSVYTYWRPDNDAPALFFNVTNTETGRTEAVSPLHFPRNLPSRKNSDMRLITAAGLSFRFPILNSPGTLPRNSFIPAQGFDPVTNYDTLETTATYVDGSYYENSGLHVLDRVRAELERSAADLNIEVRVISFTSSPNQERLRSSGSDEDTLLAPINALLAARTQRGVDEWESFLRRHGNFDAYLSLYQDNWHHHLPLGWTLSRQSVTFIKRHFGVPSDCSYTERFWEMLLGDFDGARSFLAKRFPPDDYGQGMPGIRPRDMDVKDSNRLAKLDMLSQRIYMGCQVGKIFRDLAN